MTQLATTEKVTEHWRATYDQFIKKSKKDKASRIKAICYPPWPLLFNRITVFFEYLFARLLIKKISGDLFQKQTLDIGCGTARWCEFFSGYGAKALGVDLFQPLLKENSKEWPEISFCAMSATELALKNEAVDFVSVATVMQHIPRSKKAFALEEISRVLRPGGKVFILEALGSGKNAEGNHYALLSPKEWEALLTEQGFHVMAQKTLHAYPLASLYKKGVGWIGAGIKIMKGRCRSGNTEASASKDSLHPAPEVRAAKRHLFYHFLDQNMLRLIACLSFPLEFIWLALGGKGSHQMYLAEKMR